MGNPFSRPSGTRHYRRLFLLSCEGHQTEPSYFKRFNSDTLHIECLRSNGKSAPLQVLNRLKKNRRSLQPGDQMWLVVDRDQWEETHLDELATWVQAATGAIRRGLALSNPKFEIWLLYHFEDASNYATAKTCVDRLRNYLPDYDKWVDNKRISQEMIQQAIARAEPHLDEHTRWPKQQGATSVCLLVKELLAASRS